MLYCLISELISIPKSPTAHAAGLLFQSPNEDTAMKRIVPILLMLALFLASCSSAPAQTEPEDPVPSVHTEPAESQPPTTVLEHSPLYLEGLCVEELTAYFNEVCLDAEITHSGDPSRLQKWTVPVYYQLNGSPTKEDLVILEEFTGWLNTIEGFPGIQETQDPLMANLQLHFCTEQDMLTLMGEQFAGMDGAVTFWYQEDEIYSATICCRTDLSQTLRNSVIQEEIYNGLGPIQDTDLRPDSIIYSAYSEPQELSAVDELILKLLYHPRMLCGMNAEECAVLIHELYY